MDHYLLDLLESRFLLAATRLGQGNIFTGICDSVNRGVPPPWGSGVWSGGCLLLGGVPGPGGCLARGGVCSQQGVSALGGLLPGWVPGGDPPDGTHPT